MKKYLKKIVIIALAVVCAFSVQISVSAETGSWLPDDMYQWIQDFLNGMTTTAPNQDPATTTQPQPNTTTDPNVGTTVNNPINNSGTGSITTTEPIIDPTTYPTMAYNPSQSGNSGSMEISTTAPEELPEENSSLSFEASLSDLFEQDSAAVIVQTPTEPYTIGGLVVPNDQNKDSFTWQTAALIAAAVLFVVLAALVVALLIQRSRHAKEEEKRKPESEKTPSEESAPVSVEVMTPERIAELLGTAATKVRNGGNEPMSSEESAAAIRAAAVLGQLSGTYSDPLIRKYTDEPVRFSPEPGFNLDADTATGAQVLEATASMFRDLSEDEISPSVKEPEITDEEINRILDNSDAKPKICPECGKSVGSGDIFCHSCGAYVG